MKFQTSGIQSSRSRVMKVRRVRRVACSVDFLIRRATPWTRAFGKNSTRHFLYPNEKTGEGIETMRLKIGQKSYRGCWLSRSISRCH
jgi:hypothetical protein